MIDQNRAAGPPESPRTMTSIEGRVEVVIASQTALVYATSVTVDQFSLFAVSFVDTIVRASL